LEAGDIKILSLGAIWNFGKGTGLSWAYIRLWGTKGLSIRPRRAPELLRTRNPMLINHPHVQKSCKILKMSCLVEFQTYFLPSITC
jgi:hypothetical protein